MILKQRGNQRQAHNCTKQNGPVACYKGQINHRLIFGEASKDANNIQTIKKNKEVPKIVSQCDTMRICHVAWQL